MTALMSILGALFKAFWSAMFEAKENNKNAIEATTDDRIDTTGFDDRPIM